MLDAPTLLSLVVAPAIGSFLGTLVLRLPGGEPVVTARPACRHCHHPLAARDMVPLASWLMLRLRCRYCGAALGGWHPAMELAALAIAAAVVALVPAVAVPWSCVLGWALLALALIDRRAFLLPDALTLPLLALGLLATAALDPEALPEHLVGAMLGWLGFTLVAAGYRALRGREGLGGGDAKLLAAGGAWLGWPALPAIMFGAAFLGLAEVMARRLAGAGHRAHQPIAFGTWLAAAIWLLWLFGVPGA
jgi:leader peptidase (prepilin peptidase)/N-methyltransferase